LAKQPSRAWQRMLSGRRLDLLDPSPLDVEIEDIAHGLARVARWNGQTKGEHAFSVAQHCVLVERLAVELNPRLAREARLMALLHDAPEYVVGDLISPFKTAVGIDYKDFELTLLAAIHLRFGLPARTPASLSALFKKADRPGYTQLRVPIGGVKEKVLAAHRNGLKTIVLPKRNKVDLDDVPEEIKNSMQFIYAETVDDVLEAALEPAKPENKKKTIDHKQIKLLKKSKANDKNHGSRR